MRSRQRGTRPERTPLARHSREVLDRLRPLFAFPASGVAVYQAPEGAAEQLADALAPDPVLQFVGRGLADPAGEPVDLRIESGSPTLPAATAGCRLGRWAPGWLR